jgi:hypothetical protein
MAAGKGTRGRKVRVGHFGWKAWCVRHGHAPPRSADAEERAIEKGERRRGKKEIDRQLQDA